MLKSCNAFAVIFLLISLSNVNAVFKFEYGKGLLTKLKHNRVKRAWDYPSIKLRETIAGAPFTPNENTQMQISSSNPAVSKYELVPGSVGVDDGYFTIENQPDRAVIKQRKGIDREEFAKMTIYVRAVNDDNQQVENPDAKIDFIILDQNDNIPIFIISSLTENVLESTPIGSTIPSMSLQATDADSSLDDFNKVRFYYDGGENPPKANGEERFAVSDLGQISVVSSLDKETDETITFRVVARDGFASGVGFRNSVTGTVTIHVVDDNDNAPYFSSDEYPVTVGELTVEETTIVTVKANDDDEGINKGVFFQITAGDPLGQFKVSSNPNFGSGQSSGSIVLKKPLDFEKGAQSYSLTIRAYNKEAVNNVDTMENFATVQVTVTDENEPPEFIGEPFTGFVTENVETRVDDVGKVTARDYDFGETQTVTYNLVNANGWFEIDQSTGDIAAVAPVDREHILVDQLTSRFELKVTATDGILTSTTTVAITIEDKNDNAPAEGTGWTPTICEKPTEAVKKNTSILHVLDKDSALFRPFSFVKITTDDWYYFDLDIASSSESAILVITRTPSKESFDAGSQSEYLLPIQVTDTTNGGQPAQTSTLTATVTICRCGENQEKQCNKEPIAAGIPPVAIIAIVIALLILLIIVLAVVAYRRRTIAAKDKIGLLYDEDDVRENLQAYHEEGGEEDNDGYDISALQAPPLTAPKRHDMTPLGTEAPHPRSRVPPDTDIGDYITDAKDQADNDPTAPPFDSILVFDYEGQGSDVGSLSSLNSGTTDASQDYDYLQNWGPRFKKLADMYGGGEED